MSLDVGSIVGPYRLDRLLGRGGMAVVYEATHETAGRTVALKLIAPGLDDPMLLQRFAQEGRAQATLDHPHIVTVYEAGASRFGPYLAMRLVRGTTLAGLIDDGALTTARTLELLGQIADALDAAHAGGLVHRDVKPRNVLVEDGDHAYLADFGLTRQGDATGPTLAGQFLGTIAYVAPEVVTRGDRRPRGGPVRLRGGALRVPHRHHGLSAADTGGGALRAHQRAATAHQRPPRGHPGGAGRGLLRRSGEGAAGPSRARP